MSYDIYGNTLQRGYCEVHPDVPEEYPCSVCLQRDQRESEPSQPEPTVMDYIGFDVNKFKDISLAIIDAAEQNNEDKFYNAVEKLIDSLDYEFVVSLLNKKKK